MLIASISRYWPERSLQRHGLRVLRELPQAIEAARHTRLRLGGAVRALLRPREQLGEKADADALDERTLSPWRAHRTHVELHRARALEPVHDQLERPIVHAERAGKVVRCAAWQREERNALSRHLSRDLSDGPVAARNRDDVRRLLQRSLPVVVLGRLIAQLVAVLPEKAPQQGGILFALRAGARIVDQRDAHATCSACNGRTTPICAS
jgi:hypothetical protein